jgi:PKD domain-containing protein
MPRRHLLRGVCAALIAAACSDAVTPMVPHPLFSFSPNGITRSGVNGSLNESGTQLAKGFDPKNPHLGDAVVATFYWLGSTYIVDSVVDFIANATSTRVGNPYHLIGYVTAGGYSMATYVATNVQNFPDTSSVSGQILAVRAYLSQFVTDGGVTISSWSGVADSFALALGDNHVASGSDTGYITAHTAPIAVNAGALAFTVTMGKLDSTAFTGLSLPPGFTSIGRGSDRFILEDAANQVQASAGTIDPQWTWAYAPPARPWLVSTFALNAAASPNPPPPPPPPPPTTGNLAVTTSSSGSSIPSSYTVTVDGTLTQTVASTGSVTFTGVSAASHTVMLTVPANCTVSGGPSQTVTVPAGGTATVSYSVNCVTSSGNLTVSTNSSGTSIPASYTVTVDGSVTQTVASTGSVTFANLSAASHAVMLTVPANCTVSGGPSQTVTVPAGGTATVSYSVNCVTPTGNLTVSTSSGGANIPASYTVTVDGSVTQTIASTGSVTFANLSAGSHAVALTVPANCTVSGGASQTVTVPSGGTATVSYAVDCNAPPVVNAGPNETAVTGVLYSLNWSFTDANHNGPWTYTINWGDGSTSSGTVSSEGSFTTGHTYVVLLPRSFTVRVTVTDAAGASGSSSKTVTVLLL